MADNNTKTFYSHSKCVTFDLEFHAQTTNMLPHKIYWWKANIFYGNNHRNENSRAITFIEKKTIVYGIQTLEVLYISNLNALSNSNMANHITIFSHAICHFFQSLWKISYSFEKLRQIWMNSVFTKWLTK